MMHVTVVIPVYNTPTVADTVAALHKQTANLERVEVLVVGLDEPGYVKEDGLVRFIAGNYPYTPARNRNMGMGLAKGSIICLVDADCVPNEDWLATLLLRFADSDIAVVGGGVLFDAETYWAKCDNISWFNQFLADTSPGERPFLPSLNLGLRRSVYEQVGGFAEHYPYPAGEDTEWTMRMSAADFALCFEPKAIVRHKPERSQLQDLWFHGYRFGQYSIKNAVLQEKSGIHEARQQKSSQQGAILPTLSDRGLPQRWWLLILLSPLLSFGAAVRVVHRQGYSWQALGLLPGIWLSKFAWCMGSAHTLFNGGDRRHGPR